MASAAVFVYIASQSLPVKLLPPRCASIAAVTQPNPTDLKDTILYRVAGLFHKNERDVKDAEMNGPAADGICPIYSHYTDLHESLGSQMCIKTAV